MLRVKLFSLHIVKVHACGPYRKYVAFMPYISMPIHICLRVYVYMDWSDRAMLASFE